MTKRKGYGQKLLPLLREVILGNDGQSFAQLFLRGRWGRQHQSHDGCLDLRPVLVMNFADTFLCLMS